MSNILIRDGKGSGIAAEVDAKQRLATVSTAQTELVSATKTGNAYTISTGVLNLTSANESAVLYIKSTEDSDLVIHSITVEIGASTGGSGDVIQTNYILPTGGTLISDATAAITSNLNASSSNTLSATNFKGGEGKTVSGAIASSGFIRHLSQNDIVPAGFIIPKGASLGLSLNPPAGNTSLNVSVFVLVYLLDEV